MVPYVRKSFVKHFKNGLQYVEDSSDEVLNSISNDNKYYESLSIEDNEFKKFPKTYKYAMDMTIREVKQAVEGMLHNLDVLGRLNSNIKNIAI